MTSFHWKKNIEGSLRDGLIIIIGATGIFFGLKAANLKLKTEGIPRCHGYHRTYRWNLWRSIIERLRSLQEMD